MPKILFKSTKATELAQTSERLVDKLSAIDEEIAKLTDNTGIPKLRNAYTIAALDMELQPSPEALAEVQKLDDEIKQAETRLDRLQHARVAALEKRDELAKAEHAATLRAAYEKVAGLMAARDQAAAGIADTLRDLFRQLDAFKQCNGAVLAKLPQSMTLITDGGFRQGDIHGMLSQEVARMLADGSLRGYPEGYLGAKSQFPWMFEPHKATPLADRVKAGSAWLLRTLAPDAVPEPAPEIIPTRSGPGGLLVNQ